MCIKKKRNVNKYIFIEWIECKNRKHTKIKYINIYLVNGFGRAYVNTVINNKKKTNL